MSGLTDAGNFDAYQQPVAVTYTSATLVNTTLNFNTAGMDTVAVTIFTSGTITAGQVTFNVFDGAQWIPVKSPRISSYNTDSTYLMAGTSGIQGWNVPCASYPQFQIILNTTLAGTNATALITAIVSSAPDVSVVTAGLDPNSNLPMYAANIVSPTASNGLSQFRQFCTNTVAPISIKTSGGKIHHIRCINNVATARYLKVYNASAVTVGITIPIYTFLLAPSSAFNLEDLFGISFSTAIFVAVTSGTGLDTDTNAPSNNDVLVQLDYV